ncbi:MAG TPA: SHOCT domain-containing protein [Thermoplasmata archaeon]|jgi:putative membrane protein
MTDRKTSVFVWLLVGLVASTVLIGIAAASSYSPTSGDYGMMGGWGVGMAFMVVPAIILILVLIIVIGGLEERPVHNTYPVYVPPQPSPLDIIDQRYARGEIGRDEYSRMRAEFGKR